MEIFGKKEYLQRYSSFLGCTGIIGISLYHLRHHTSTMLFDEMRGLFVEKIVLFHLAENSDRFSHTNGKRSLLNGTYASHSNLFVEKLYCSHSA